MTNEQYEVIKRIVLQVPLDFLANAPTTYEVRDIRLTVADLTTLYVMATERQTVEAAHWGLGQ